MSIPCLLTNLIPMLAEGDAIGPAPTRSPWMAVVLMLVLAVGLGVAAFMSSRREHRD